MSELRGCRVRQIDDAAVFERTAVIDSDGHAAAIVQIRHLYIRWQRQRLVRGRHRVHVVALAVRRALRVKARAVPGRDAAFEIAVGVASTK